MKARQTNAAKYTAEVYPTVRELADKGLSLRGIAKELAERNILTARGGTNWSAVTVRNILKRGNA